MTIAKINFIKKHKTVVIHISVWIVFILVNTLQMYLTRGDLSVFFLILSFNSILFFYVNYLYLVPKFLLVKNTKTYFIFVFLLILIQVFLFIYFEPSPLFRNSKIPDELLRMKPPGLGFAKYLFPAAISTFFLVIGTSIRVYEEWNRNEKHKKDIQALKIDSELHFLKNQLNPHFLFNSLNSIYSLTRKKSDEAPEAVITLSELMRYMLYQTNNDFVLLKDELNYIQNYLVLQRLRLPNNENVAINIRGSLSNQKIRPLFLITFIENAFKLWLFGYKSCSLSLVFVNPIPEF